MNIKRIIVFIGLVFNTLWVQSQTTSAVSNGIAIQGIARNASNEARAEETISISLELYYFNALNNDHRTSIKTQTVSLTTDVYGVFSYVLDPGSFDVIFSNNLVYLKISEGATVISDAALKQVAYVKSARNGAPIGTIVPFMGTTAPDGWLLCNGQSLVGKEGVFDLATHLGSNNVPDLRGMFLRGSGSRTISNHTYSGPSVKHTQADLYKSHRHGHGTLSTNYTGSHKHANGDYKYFLRKTGSFTSNKTDTDHTSPYEPNLVLVGEEKSSGGHSHTVTGSTGSTGGVETRPVSYGVNYIIKM